MKHAALKRCSRPPASNLNYAIILAAGALLLFVAEGAKLSREAGSLPGQP